MAVRLVNVVPNVKIKKEMEVPDVEDVVSCKVCGRGYASVVALSNHVRMEHVEIYLAGDQDAWLNYLEVEEKPKIKSEVVFDQNLIRQNTQKLISSMGPQNLMSLASKDVSYIIIKSEDIPKMKRKRDADRQPVTRDRRDREPKDIAGPFECLQPSNLVADGTCHQIFFSCCEYSAHFRDEHTRRRKGLRCQVCEKPLTAGQEPYACDVCGLGFTTAQELSEHTATAHVKLKPFQCSVCHKRFTQQGGVQQHMRMHTGDRPFPCTFCPKAFTQKSGLDQHLRIHTKVKPYRCVICAKTFCQSIHLKQHMRTHTNVSPFQCAICQKRFKQSSHLNYHLKNHNPANMSDEQKAMYAELIGMMKNEDKFEVESIMEQEMVETEQVLAEQNIQVISEEEYIFRDDDNETWSVQLVES